jgi:hypothetical protein
MVIIVDTIAWQYKMQSRTWSSPSRSSRTTSCGSHANHLTFCNEHPTIIYKITFNSSPFRLMSSHYIWNCSFHTMAIHYIIIPRCIFVIIILFISFKKNFTTNLFIAFDNIFFIFSSFMESNLDSPIDLPHHP